jgi:hypothetical protein
MRISSLGLAALLCGLGCAGAPPRPSAVEAESESADSAQAPHVKESAPDLKETARPPGAGAAGTISRAELNKVLDAAPGRFLQHVQTEPRFVGGRFRGWKLAAFYPGDARFAGVDLRAGDVVLAVNGRSIEQPEQLMEVWEALRFERVLVISLERDGQPRQLRFEIRD